MTDTTNKMRIAKFMSSAGLCSRREAERWIAEGRVQVNGETIDSPALNVSAEDAIIVDGKTITQNTSKPRLYCLNKPKGYICTSKDTHDRKTVFELVPPGLPRLVTVGRLDLNSEGLLLFTDQPSLAEKLMRPNNGLSRVYKVRIDGFLDEGQKAALQNGITIEGIHYKGVLVEQEEKQTKRNNWITLTLTEGKNREIRKLMQSFGLHVSRLVRVSYGGLELGGLPKSGFVEVPYKRIEKVLEGLK